MADIQAPAISSDALAAARAASAAMGGSIKSDANPSFTYMSDKAAQGLSESTRNDFAEREANVKEWSQNIRDGETALREKFRGQMDVPARDTELTQSQLNYMKNSDTGLNATQDALKKDEIAASRAVDAVAEVAPKMGITSPPPVTLRMSNDANAWAGNGIDPKFNSGLLNLMDNKELAWAAGHELAHTKGITSELGADAAAIKATCDIESAKTALAKVYKAGEVPDGKPADAEHPSLEKRVSNMQEVYDHSECKAPPTPATQPSGSAPALPDR